MTLSVAPVSRNAVKAFIREHHRHNKRLAPAAVLHSALADEDGELVGVAIAGMPARPLMDGYTLEVTRVCTLGHRNACSQLYGSIARAAKALGWRTLYTYTRADEPGSSPRAAGFIEDGRVPASNRATKNGARPRYDVNLLGERVEADEDDVEKIRWRLDLVARADIRN